MKFYLVAKSLIQVLTDEEQNERHNVFAIDKLIVSDGEHTLVAKCGCYDIFAAMPISTKFQALYKASVEEKDPLQINLFTSSFSGRCTIILKEPVIKEIAMVSGEDNTVEISITIKYRGITYEHAK